MKSPNSGNSHEYPKCHSIYIKKPPFFKKNSR